MKEVEKTKQQKIMELEESFDLVFPQSYRQFLLEQGSAVIAGYQIYGIPEKEEKGVSFSFQPGDPKRGSFSWITEYQGRIVGLCNRPDCNVCNLEEREKLRDFQRGELKVELSFYQKETKEFYIAHLISIPEKEVKKEKPKISVLQATETLRRKRKDLSQKKLVVICSKKSLTDGKEKALCMDLTNNPQDDAPLFEVSDINQEGAPFYPHHSFKEWLEHLRKLEERDKRFQAVRQRLKNRKNEIRERVLKREIGQRFKNRCPVCRKEERDDHLICSQCFNGWQRETQEEIDLVEWLQDRLEARGVNLPRFTHRGGKEVRRIYIRPQDWHTRIFRVRDYAVGLTAFRYRTELACLEVDTFWSGDLPGYVKGQAIRNLAIAILSEAYSLTGSLSIAFTKDVREDEATGRIVKRNQRGRISQPIPQELVELAEQYNIVFKQVEQGRISHQEGIQFFWAVLEWPNHLQGRVDELEEKKYLTKEALARVIYSGIWSKEEAIWLFENAPRVEAIILGSDVPENRLLYTESVYYGRAAYLANLLKTKISSDLAQGLSVEERGETDCVLEPQGRFWVLRAPQEFKLPWLIKGSEPVMVKPNEPVLILSVPCQTTKPEYDKCWIRENVEIIKNAESDTKIRCLLVSFEFSDLKYGMKISEEMRGISKELTEKGVYLLSSPYRLDLLDDEVENRMSRARRRRHFPSRVAPLRVQLIEIPKTRWQKHDLLYSVEDAQSAAIWIRKKISQKLGRIRFRANCGCIERIAIQDSESKKVAEFDGKDSENLLTVLKDESGITLPFVLSKEMPEFIEKTSGEVRSVLKDVKSGIVAVVSPYEGLSLEPEIKPAYVPVGTSVSSGFQFPTKPDEVDFKKYIIKRKEEIVRAHQQIQESLRPGGPPLAVSYLSHEILPEVMRDYLYYTVKTEYQEKRFLFFFKYRKKYERREPAEPANLCLVYQDGTEGQPFPLFCLAGPEIFPRPTNLYQFKIGSISMRHVVLDLITEGYLIQNILIKRKETSVEQQDYAFRRTWHFLMNFVDLVQHKRVEEITQEIRFKYFWEWLDRKDGLKNKKYNGCELHIYQTGLEPAVVGIYQAVVKFLQERRGELVVVPRLIGIKERKELKGKEEIRETTDAAYLKAAEWF